ncbi:MAG TPA: hypothetical protein PKD86_09600 [Gemmatales bacterium]|nr:hypothetical protein [Gemmatales bacterium]
MSDKSKPTPRLGRVPAVVISAVVSGLLGLAAGAKVDELYQPALGPTGAAVAGFGTAFVVLGGLGLVSYRALTR